MHGQASAAAVLAAGGVAATLRRVGLAVDPGNAFVLVLGPTHGVTFGATHLSSVFLLANLAPRWTLAQAQSWLAMGWAGAMAALTALAGYVYGSSGDQIYSPMAAASSVGVLLLIPVVASLRREEAQPLAVASSAELPLQKLG